MSFIFLFVCNLLAQSTDCCDGSDEYDGQVKCQNTCWEAGKAARDKLRKKIATYKEGVALRRQVVEQAKQAIAKDEAELSKLKSGERILQGIVQQLKGIIWSMFCLLTGFLSALLIPATMFIPRVSGLSRIY